MIRGLLIAVPFLLAACAGQDQTELSRATAKSVINPILAQRFPGVPLQPATDCVIDNASGNEIAAVAAAAANRNNRQAIGIVLDVLQRPTTVQCIAAEGLPVLLTNA